MILRDRLKIILKENNLKQKDLASVIGVTESYISAIINGRNNNISQHLANLIEEKYGYGAQWILTGEGSKIKQVGKNPSFSNLHKKAIMQIDEMNEQQIRAVLVFLDSLEELERCFKAELDADDL